MDTFDKVRSIMAEILQMPKSQIIRELKQEDLEEWDSLQHLNLMLALEQEFDVTLDVDALRTLTSVLSILDYLEDTCPSN